MFWLMQSRHLCPLSRISSNACAEKAIKLVRNNLMKVYQHPDDIHRQDRRCTTHPVWQELHSATAVWAWIMVWRTHLVLISIFLMDGRMEYFFHMLWVLTADVMISWTPYAKCHARIARILRLDGPSIRQSAFSVVRTSKQFIKQLHIPDSIEAAGVSREDFGSCFGWDGRGSFQWCMYKDKSESMLSWRD